MIPIPFMYDALNPGDIPPDAGIVAAFIDGPKQWPTGDWFPGARRLNVTMTGLVGADTAWCAAGGLSTGQTVTWLSNRIGLGGTLNTVFCHRAQVAAVQSACAGLSPFQLWVDDITGEQHTIDGIPQLVAVRYASSGGYFTSAIYSETWLAQLPT